MTRRRTALVIRHIAFEDLGSLAAPLEHAGYRIDYRDAAANDLAAIDPLAADLLIVLGGPMGVYEAAFHPFIRDEIRLLEARLAADLPTFGICLGAPLIAHVLGSRVYPGPVKEIGWGEVTLTAAGRAGPLAAIAAVPVLHWHGDTFDLPAGCDLLASTAHYSNQAFARGPRLLGLQFHPEAHRAGFECWLDGHAGELAAEAIDPAGLRAAAAAHADALAAAAVRMMERWLAAL